MQVVTITREYPLELFRRGFIDHERFSAACAACGGFGKTWACPPYDFDPDSLWQSYERILLYAKKAVFDENETERVYEKHELAKVYDSVLKPVKLSIMNELLELEAKEPGSLALFAGGCDVCESCTRPQGLPCRAPEKMRYSVESIGGDVLGAVEKLLGESILWAQDGRLPRHFILMGALLKK